MKFKGIRESNIYSNFKDGYTNLLTAEDIENAIIDLRRAIVYESPQDASLKSIDQELQRILSEDGFLDQGLYSKIVDSPYSLVGSDLSQNDSKQSYNQLVTKLSSVEAIREAVSLFEAHEETTQIQKEFLGAFLNNAVGNMELNSNISKLANNQSKYLNLKYSGELSALKRFSYKSRVLDDVQKQKDKIDFLETMEPNSTVPYSKRFTIEEFGKLSDLHSAYTSFERFASSCGNIDSFEKLRQIRDFGEIAGGFIEYTQNEFKEHSQNSYKAGDIVMYDIDKRSLVTNNKLDRESKLTKRYVTNYGHAATVATGSGGAKLSHVYGEYQVDDLDLEKGLFSDVYRMDLGALLTKEAKQAAQNLYGDKWNEKVNEIYPEVSSKLFELSQQDQRYALIFNSSDKRFNAGIMSYIPFGNTLLKATNWDNMREQFSDKTKGETEMICSEFASRLAIVSLMESNEKLQEVLGLEKNALNIPFSKREDLDKVHPGRLIDILHKADCIKEVPPSIIQTQFFKRPEENFKKITSQVYKSFKKCISSEMDTEAICTKLVNVFEIEHNKRFPNDKVELDASTRDMLTIVIKNEVDNIKTQMDDAKNAHNEMLNKNLFTKIYGAICKIVNLFYKKLDQHIDQNIAKDSVNIIDKLIEGVEKQGSWVNRSSSLDVGTAQGRQP
ncbi:hypothetical protein Cyrtocomes_00275 [Candidatus Cyrtobacter comes]|uniref:Uncharacterized protein n=1 Tax=Candidatus Cyrtobacter comes TaxID=675776 RepID=A0ABU5L7N7_9RICK|nr:hypothetical protein [Candidatus Cyrtobacter comes]MDZ5761915.1 hypothetical protein [Candidatus Cyrtobacter comes]